MPMTTVIRTLSTMGLMPTPRAMGYRMGMNRVSVAMDSMNMVTMKKISRIMMRMTVGLVEKPSMVLATHLSKPAVVSMTVYSFAAPITMKIRPLVRTVSAKANLMSSHLSSR